MAGRGVRMAGRGVRMAGRGVRMAGGVSGWPRSASGMGGSRAHYPAELSIGLPGHLPSSVFRLPSSVFRLPSSVFRLPSSVFVWPPRARARARARARLFSVHVPHPRTCTGGRARDERARARARARRRRGKTRDGRRETGDGRRETGDGRRETGDERRETGDGRRETRDGRRETRDEGGRRRDSLAFLPHAAVPSLQLHAHVLQPRPLDRKRRPRGRLDARPGDRARPPGVARPHERRELRRMPLVRPQGARRARLSALGQRQRPPVVEPRNLALAEHLVALLGHARIAHRRVDQRPHAAVRERQRRDDVVVAAVRPLGAEAVRAHPDRRRARPVRHQVDEMAALAHDAPPALGRVREPARVGHAPRVDPRDHHEPRAPPGERVPHRLRERREPAIEPDLQATPRPGHRLRERRELRLVDRRRLLQEHVAARGERLRRLRRVARVPRRDHHRVHRRERERRVDVAQHVLRPEPVRRVPRREAAPRYRRHELRARELRERRQEHARRERARPHHRDPQRGPVAPDVLRPDLRHRRGARRALRVGEQHAEVRLRPLAGHHRVRVERVLEREAVRHQAQDVEPLRLDRAQHRLEVAALRPAHVADRVVVAALLVRGIVAPRAVAARDDELQLLVVVRLARDLDRHHPDRHHAGPVARDVTRGDQRLVRRRRGRDHHRVRADPARERAHDLDRIVARGHHAGDRPARLRPLDLGRVEIDADDVAAVRREELHRDLPEQPEADHHHARPERRAREPHAVQRDRAHGHERGLLVRHRVGHPHHEVQRHRVDLRVVREARARARDAIAAREARRPGAHLRDAARERVAERDRVVELGPDRVERREHALALRLVEHLGDQVRPVLGLHQQVLAGHVDDGALRARRDQRDRRVHQDAAGGRPRRRRVHQRELPRPITLRYLTHADPPRTYQSKTQRSTPP
ncbi:uncharacterized protein SOCEGT47_019930 [Sorangium cellulosum]|uniref:Uncharacterized protein n=1 Tax=Sorangium cellulosum TaxID=56 RepID=A0A4P2PXG0_SORCE|nr:uncharacterized protein SOCEGT47_019930 [Sorangium cellulosum]